MNYKEIIKRKKEIEEKYVEAIKKCGYQDIEVELDRISYPEIQEINWGFVDTYFWEKDFGYNLSILYGGKGITYENDFLIMNVLMRLLEKPEYMHNINIKEQVLACFVVSGFEVVRVDKFFSNENGISMSISKDGIEYSVRCFRRNGDLDLSGPVVNEDPLEFSDEEILDVRHKIEDILNKHGIVESKIEIRTDLQNVNMEFIYNFIKCEYSVLGGGNYLFDSDEEIAFYDSLYCFLEHIKEEKDFRKLLIDNSFHIHTKTMCGSLILAYRHGVDYEIRIKEEQTPEYKEMQRKKTLQKYMMDFDSMDGHAFEHYSAKILSLNGFERVHVTQGSGDQGVDIIAFKDGVKYGIQCKCYSADIGNKAVQEAFAGKAYYDCHVGVVLTNRFFTKAAKELASKNGIILWNRNKFLQMIENCNL